MLLCSLRDQQTRSASKLKSSSHSIRLCRYLRPKKDRWSCQVCPSFHHHTFQPLMGAWSYVASLFTEVEWLRSIDSGFFAPQIPSSNFCPCRRIFDISLLQSRDLGLPSHRSEIVLGMTSKPTIAPTPPCAPETMNLETTRNDVEKWVVFVRSDPKACVRYPDGAHH